MKKYFELPKEFAEKWLEALRSNKYQQGIEFLYTSDTNSFCCIGVAGDLCGIDHDIMEDRCLFTDKEFKESGEFKLPEKFPYVLYRDNSQDVYLEGDLYPKSVGLISCLTCLNDGLDIDWYKSSMKAFPNLIFSKIPTQDKEVQYSFEEIADWIETNVEFK